MSTEAPLPAGELAIGQQRGPHLRTVHVGPFAVVDASVAAVVDWVKRSAGRQAAVFALHVGGLNAATDEEFVTAMNAADLVYADGISVVALARIGGAVSIEAAPTTDTGWMMLQALADSLGRSVRVAIFGGEPGVARRAGERFRLEGLDVEIVYAENGFRQDAEIVAAEISSSRPDVVIVGLGMPLEAKWVTAHLPKLPHVPVITCGGWLGFLAGDEKRAPGWVRRAHLEWAFRLVQSPTRLWRRYFNGAWTVARLVPGQLAGRKAEG